MTKDFKSVIEKVLTLVGYQDDKDAFVNEFMSLCMRKSLADYGELLPEERKKILQQILQESDPSKVKEEIEPYITTEEFGKILTQNTQMLLQDYFQTIMPTLSEEQKKNLDAYFASLKADQVSAASQNV